MATIQNFAYTGNPIVESITTSGAVGRVVKDEFNNTIATLTAEAFGGIARVRYDAIVRTLFSDVRTAVTQGEPRIVDRNISAVAVINGTRYVFSRGAAQTGGEADGVFKIKSTMPRLRWFDGYELGVVFAHDVRSFTATINGNDIEQNPYPTTDNGILFFDLSTNPYGGGSYNGVIGLKDNSTGASLDTIPVVACHTPKHPFYIRFINERGGYDYHMFACNQRVKWSLTENTYFEKDGAEGVQTTLAKSGAKQITVSSGRVDAATFDALARMPWSPDIRWFNEAVNAWVPIQIAECTPERMTESPTAEFTCTFILPNPQINK